MPQSKFPPIKIIPFFVSEVYLSVSAFSLSRTLMEFIESQDFQLRCRLYNFSNHKYFYSSRSVRASKIWKLITPWMFENFIDSSGQWPFWTYITTSLFIAFSGMYGSHDNRYLLQYSILMNTIYWVIENVWYSLVPLFIEHIVYEK